MTSSNIVNVPDRDHVAQQLVNAGMSQTSVRKIYTGISRTSVIGARGQKSKVPQMTHVYIKGDQSGSMNRFVQAYIDSINLFTQSLLGSTDKGTIMLSISHFNSANYERRVFVPDPSDPNSKPDPLQLVYASTPLEDAQLMDRSMFQPDDYTPLYDANIAWGAQVAANVETQLNEGIPIRRVIMLDFSDGLQEHGGSSYIPYQFNEPEDVSPMMTALRDSGIYVPVFIGFGSGFKKIAVAMGYDPDNVIETGTQTESNLRKVMQLASERSVSVSQGKIAPGNKFFQST